MPPDNSIRGPLSRGSFEIVHHRAAVSGKALPVNSIKQPQWIAAGEVLWLIGLKAKPQKGFSRLE